MKYELNTFEQTCQFIILTLLSFVITIKKYIIFVMSKHKVYKIIQWLFQDISLYYFSPGTVSSLLKKKILCKQASYYSEKGTVFHYQSLRRNNSVGKPAFINKS